MIASLAAGVLLGCVVGWTAGHRWRDADYRDLRHAYVVLEKAYWMVVDRACIAEQTLRRMAPRHPWGDRIEHYESLAAFHASVKRTHDLRTK